MDDSSSGDIEFFRLRPMTTMDILMMMMIDISSFLSCVGCFLMSIAANLGWNFNLTIEQQFFDTDYSSSDGLLSREKA